MCQLSAVLIVVFCVAAVVAAAVRAVGPFRRVRGQALLSLAPEAKSHKAEPKGNPGGPNFERPYLGQIAGTRAEN